MNKGFFPWSLTHKGLLPKKQSLLANESLTLKGRERANKFEIRILISNLNSIIAQFRPYFRCVCLASDHGSSGASLHSKRRLSILNNQFRSHLAWGQKLSIQGRASFSGSGVEEDRRVNQRVLNIPIAEKPIFSLAIAKKPHSSCHKSTSSKACPAWHSA